MNRQRPSILLLVSVALSSLLVGCASYHLRTPSIDDDGLGDRKTTVHGLWWKAPELPSCSCVDGINNVYVEDNLLLDIVGVITLGIWKPIDVRYRCRAAADIGQPPPPPPEYTERTAHAFFWGLWNDPQIIAANECIDGFYDVKVADNLGYDLISIITLGIWKPMTVRYRCRPDPLE